MGCVCAPIDEDVAVARKDGFDEMVEVVLHGVLIDRQAERLAQRFERFPGPTTLAVRAELGGEQVGGRRELSSAVLVRPGGEEADERPGSLPASWRE